MYKVSIIIPVYNAEKYLKKCIGSAVNQTLQEIEIICVNDGSVDNSLQIMEQVAEIDDRVKILNKTNTGYGNTMNVGIDYATGKYLVFLESDDFILPGMCEELYKLCEEHSLEIVKADYYEFKMKGDRVCCRYRKTSDYNNYHKILKPQLNLELFYASMYTWTCMYKREFINKLKIRHHETPGASYQDNGFWFQTLMYCERMYLLDRAFYMYRQDNPNSSIHSKGKVCAFSDEYAFIRKRIEEYKGNSENFWSVCSFFNIHHNIISLKRVDKAYTEELIQLISKDIGVYKKLNKWKIKHLDVDFIKKMMIVMLQPNELKESVWRYTDKYSKRKELLDKFSNYILYGAGVYARNTLLLLEDCKMWNKDISCGVTSLTKRGERINDIEIQEMKELLQHEESALVIVCAKKHSENYNQMCNNLKKWGVRNVVHSTDLIVKDFWEDFL